MAFFNHGTSEYKTKRITLFLVGQILLGILIIAIIVWFGSKVYRDDLNEVKRLRLNSKIEDMKEIVNNTIIRIDMRRKSVDEHCTELINICTKDAANHYTDSDGVKRVLNFVYGAEAGRVIQAIIDDGNTYLLFNEANKDGISISKSEEDALLGRDAIRNSFQSDGRTVYYFALREDVDELVKSDEHYLIHSLKYTGDSYVWVNEILKPEGGDNYAIRRIHPNLKSTEGEYLSTSMQDIKGNYPYKTELEGIMKNGEVVHKYYFKNKSNDEISEKISYAAFYEPYNWIVATGTPMDALYSDIGYMSEKRMGTLFAQISLICVLVIILQFFCIKKTIDGLSKATHEAESASKAKSVFLFNMSHDIRTPMNVIIGFTRVARENLDDKEKVADSLSKIEDSGLVLQGLIDDVLEVARIESGKMELNCSLSNINDGVAGVREVFEAEMAEKGIQFISEVNVKNNFVMCDCVKVNRICFNLLSNALKFTPAGGRIEYRLSQLSDIRDDGTAEYEIRVKDNGIGMSEDFQKHLFDMFERERTSTVSRVQGTGLGLTIVKNIVSFLGGTIEVVSRKGEGSEFIIRFPLEIADEIQIPENTDKASIKEVNFAGRRILLAEDNELNREIASEIFTNMGFEVEAAENGSVALDKLMNSDPGYFDLVIMDIQMPVMDGYETTEKIRQLPDKRLAHIPIVAMTANAFDEDRKKAIVAGMTGYIAKPIDMAELTKTLVRIFQGR